VLATTFEEMVPVEAEREHPKLRQVVLDCIDVRLPLARDWAACSAWSRHAISVKRRLLLPAARHRHPEHGPGDAALGAVP
jgi:hypothetical protein